MYLILAPAYRHIISHTIHKISTVHKSGIIKKTINSTAFNIMKNLKNSILFIIFCFLNNHHHRNNTYHNLKNSAGWILGRNGISIHHLAQFSTTPSHGINTKSCSTIRTMDITVIFFSFWKNLIGTKYINHDIKIHITRFLICL